MLHVLKITHNSFNYYKLYIFSNTTAEQIQQKLSALKQSCGLDELQVVVHFDRMCMPNILDSLLASIQAITYNLGIKVHAVSSELFEDIQHICGFPVLDMPNDNAYIGGAPTLLIDYHVRNGMRIEHDGNVVVVNGVVSHSAEIEATGDVHVYSIARGKIFAGSGGNRQARIFVIGRIQLELISIAGVFKVLGIDNNNDDDDDDSIGAMFELKHGELQVVRIASFDGFGK
jgi:septum site-determining protein MinC